MNREMCKYDNIDDDNDIRKCKCNDNMIAWNLFMMTGDPDDYMRYRKIKGTGGGVSDMLS